MNTQQIKVGMVIRPQGRANVAFMDAIVTEVEINPRYIRVHLARPYVVMHAGQPMTGLERWHDDYPIDTELQTLWKLPLEV